MRRRAILGLSLSCLLAACAHQGDSGAAGMAWSLNDAEGEGAKLAYGQPASDNVLLMMTCQPRSGLVRVSVSVPPGAAPDAVEIAAKGHTSRLPGSVSPGMGDDAIIEAAAPASDPALASFARGASVAVGTPGRTIKLPLAGDARSTVRDFFNQCRAG